MDFEPEDQEVIQLLTKIKNAGGEYPEHLMVARRRSYLKRMAEIGMGIPAETIVREAPKEPPPPPPAASSIGSTLIETILVVAILAEASAVAYFYRDRFADFFETITVQASRGDDTPAPVVTTSLEIQGVVPSQALLPTIPSVTLSPGTTSTSIPPTSTAVPATAVADEQNITSGGVTAAGASGNAIQQIDSTPVPNSSSGGNGASGDQGNNGNHYGQTPKPERTKDTNPNNDNNNSGGNSVDSGDPSSGIETKPTKDK